MSIKHTPGPWFSDEDHFIRQGTPGSTYQRPIMVAIGWIEGAWTGDDSNEESRANCRLIAAAPELLEALKIVADGFARGAIKSKMMLANVDDESAETMPMLVGDIVRAAIAKATGAAS